MVTNPTNTFCRRKRSNEPIGQLPNRKTVLRTKTNTKTAMKTLLCLFLLSLGVVTHAQSIPLVEGQPFPFRAGIAISKATVDSTRNYVGNLEDSLLSLKRERVDLKFQLSSLTNERGEYSKALAICSTKLDKTIQEKEAIANSLQRKTVALKTRFWIGTTAGIAIAYTVGILIRR